MRIRKHAQIYPLVYEEESPLRTGGTVETYVCKLNQSPWNTIIFPSSEYPVDPTAAPQPPPSPPPLLYPVDGEDNSSMAANGSTFLDCPEAENCELSMNFALDDDEEKCVEVVDRNCNFEIDDDENVEENSKSPCRKKVVKELMSNYSPAHHRTSSSSHHVNRRNKLTKRPVSVSRRIRPKKPPSTSNPNEFYYYSGFGPRWGRRRRGPSPPDTTKVVTEEESYSSESLNIGPTDTAVKVGAESLYSSRSLKNNNVVEEATTTPEEVHIDLLPSRICNDGFDYVEDEFDDDEEEDYAEDIGENVRKKRGRKPIKARSLKSLM